MRITSRIYGRQISKSPDMIFEFDISEEMKEGNWSYGVSNIKHEMKNELIDCLNENIVVEKLKTFVKSLLNTQEGPKWVQNPKLQLLYNDETNDICMKTIK